MERLTERLESGATKYIPRGLGTFEKCIERLAAYEDTGLEPEEIKDVQEALEPIPFGHFRDIMEAERAGRLVVLPCKPGQTIWAESCTRGRAASIEAPDITWIIENTKRFGEEIFLTREEAEAVLKKRKETDDETD